SIKLIVCPAVFNRDVLALEVAGLLQATMKSAQTVREFIGRCRVEKPDHRHRRLLRPRRERPHHCRAAEQRDERATLHSITSSARARNDSGIVSPSALAVLRLMTNSTFVTCCTGRSAAFSPLRMRPV